MTASTEQERAEFTDGAWYWVEKEGWHDEPPKIAPAMYRAACDAWYSWEFSGVSTQYLKVLEPCTRHEQAARRAPAVPETIEQRAKKLKGLQVLIGATAGVPEAIELARSRFTEAYGRSPLHDDLAYACLLIDAYGGAPAVPVPQGLREAAQAVVERWDTPLWKDVPATAGYIANLRAALAAAPQPQEAEDGPSSCAHCGNPWGEVAP